MALGIDVLVEKPMAASLTEADALLETARRHQRILQVGHVDAVQSGGDCRGADPE